MGEIHVQVRCCDKAREQLDHQVPAKRRAPRSSIHSIPLQRDHRDGQSTNVGKSGTQNEAQRQHDIDKPNDQSGYHPDRCQPHDDRLIEKQAESEDEVSNIAHPQHVPELIDSPVVYRLRYEEDQRENTKPAMGDPRHQCLHGREA